MPEADRSPNSALLATVEMGSPDDELFPPGTLTVDRLCGRCGGWMVYRHGKIVCQHCGFTRDCSDL